MGTIIASRTFLLDEQLRFADLTGDWNPMHVDAERARRTPAGRPAVHGIHLLIWALDASADLLGWTPARIDAHFLRFVGIGEQVRLDLAMDDAGSAVCSILGGDGVRARFVIGSTAKGAASPLPSGDWPFFAPDTIPLDIDEGRIAALHGRVQARTDAGTIARAAPHAARLIGEHRLAMLGASTRLVGMICPGEHSLYSRLTIDMAADDESGTLAFAVKSVRHGLVECRIAGGGIAGTLHAIIRPRPTAQASSAQLRGRIRPLEFAGSRALIVGGSRGLGECAAKVLALGGADVTITYRASSADADRVAADIAAAGGSCRTIHLDVAGDQPAYPAAPNGAFTHALYFAAPQIVRSPPRTAFSPERHALYTSYFVDAFDRLCSALVRAGAPVRVFYPSTTYIDQRPTGFTEYRMAKAAGEILCEELNRQGAALHVLARRLPRMLTDQTAGFADDIDAETLRTADTLLPMIRELYEAAEGDLSHAG